MKFVNALRVFIIKTNFTKACTSLNFTTTFFYTQGMSTLANVTQETRLILKAITGLAVFFLIIFLIFQGFNFLRNNFFPPTPPPPTQEFGKIENLSTPQSKENITYTLNTVSGQLPESPDRMNIYKIDKPSVNLQSLNNLRNTLSSLGFTNDERKINDTTYEWSNPNVGTTIRYEITSNDFDIISSESAQEALASSSSLEQKNLMDTVSGFLTSLNFKTNDINFDNSKTSYFTIKNGVTSPTNKAFEANMAQLYLFQGDINNLTIYYPYYSGSNMYFDIVSSDRNQEIVSGHFSHSLINDKSFSTYPIKTPNEAYSDLKKGNAFIYNESGKNMVEILEVTRGYFLKDGENNFLLPIYIFKGNNFIAYVPALRN